jgi:hypothetical protein
MCFADNDIVQRLDLISGLVYWVLETTGCALLSSIWVQIHHRDQDDAGANRSLPAHIAHVLQDSIRAELRYYYDQDHDGNVTMFEVCCRQCYRMISCQLGQLTPECVPWQVFVQSCRIVKGTIEKVLNWMVRNAPVAFTLHVLGHITSVARLLTIAASICFWSVVLVCSLWGADLLVPFCKQVANKGTHCCFMIMAMFFCGAGAIITFGLALYDFGYTSVGIGQAVAAAAQRATAEESLLRTLYHNVTSLMDEGYDSFEESHNNETWWPVAAGIRVSVDEGLNGTQLITRAYMDTELIYRNTSWWPAVSALHVAFVKFRTTGSNEDGEVADFGAIWQGFNDVVGGNPVEFLSNLGETAAAIGFASVNTVSSAAFFSMSSMLSVVTVGSQWAISTFTFVFLLLPAFTCMELDALDILASTKALAPGF